MPFFLSYLKTFRSRFPITLFGMAVLALSLYSLVYIGLEDSDLVLTVISSGALLFVSVAFLTVLLQSRALQKRIKLSLEFPHEKLISNLQIPAGMILSECSVPPLLALQIKRDFVHSGGISSATHELRGNPREAVWRIADTLIFPHRGVWQIRSATLRLGDLLGLAAVEWQLPLTGEIEISAPQVELEEIPVVSSAYRTGDLLSHSNERLGDPYDTKPYDPGDGTSRILWKIYARSGELVVRRPEFAAIPDGEVAVYLVADRFGDRAAGALMHYIAKLALSGIGVLFSTDGLEEQGEIISAPEKITRKMNESVWSSDAGSGADFPAFVQALQERDRFITDISIFIQSELLDSVRPVLAKESAANNLRLHIVLIDSKPGKIAAISTSNLELLSQPTTSMGSLLEIVHRA